MVVNIHDHEELISGTFSFRHLQTLGLSNSLIRKGPLIRKFVLKI